MAALQIWTSCHVFRRRDHSLACRHGLIIRLACAGCHRRIQSALVFGQEQTAAGSATGDSSLGRSFRKRRHSKQFNNISSNSLNKT
jgi:hypothetical protein